MEDLNIDLAQAGLAISIVCLVIAFMGLISGYLVRKLGAAKIFLIGLCFMGLGASLTHLAYSYSLLMITRVFIGAGFGLCIPVSGSIIMMLFQERERPYLNTVNSLLPYIATAITFSLAPFLYYAFAENWRLTITTFGLGLITIAVFWLFSGRNGIKEDPAKDIAQEKYLFSVIRNREVILLSIAEASDMWAFQFLTAYLPTYYTQEAGLGLVASAKLTSIFPVAGIIAGLLCGIWMSKVGLRKPFTWPLHLSIFAGTYLAINGTGFARILGISLAGFGNAGWAPALFTMPMEFRDMNPAKVGTIYSIMFSLGFFAAFLSPLIGGYIAQNIGLHRTIFYFSFSSVIAALATFLMKETGPAKRKISEGFCND